jgi:hypothetical protein
MHLSALDSWSLCKSVFLCSGNLNALMVTVLSAYSHNADALPLWRAIDNACAATMLQAANGAHTAT